MTWTGPRRSARAITDPDRQAGAGWAGAAAAEAGDLDRAEAAARAITDPGQRAQALAGLAGRRRRRVTWTGPRRLARRRSPTRTGGRRRWLGWRRRRREAGDLDRAGLGRPRRRPGRSPTRTSRRGRWLGWRGRRRGRVTWTGPRRLARAITDPDRQAQALAGLAQAAAEAGDLDRARRWPTRPRRLPGRSPTRKSRRERWSG